MLSTAQRPFFVYYFTKCDTIIHYSILIFILLLPICFRTETKSIRMKTIFTSILYTLISFPLLGQVFWQQDFSSGIPADWTNEAISNVDLVWTYCSDTTAYGTIEEPGCPFDFTGGDNQQNHFKSETPENGFACCVVEPVINQLGGTSAFDSRLTTSAIDCSTRNEVYITFSSHIGVFDQIEPIGQSMLLSQIL